MTKRKNLYRMIPIIIIIAASMLLSSCSTDDKVADPRTWGYDCIVIYDALGGTINSREMRETYYMKNSYVFKPAGTTNMLIEPVKDGYILAGWYTDKEDIKDASGNITGYKFKAEDRWDFDEDRVQGDMTLYARWIPQGRVEYVDASSGQVMFSKNITSSSPIQPLSGATEKLIQKSGYTFAGYFEDEACTIPYDFTQYTHQELIPSNEEVYAELAEAFPQYFDEVEYVEPVESESDEEEVTIVDTSDLFLNKLGYEITTDDPEVRKRIRARKDRIFEDAINNYVKNSSNKTVYLKYTEGSYVNISKPEDLKSGSKYLFSGLDKNGNPIEGYILQNDIDFSGLTLDAGEIFSGKIQGNGYSLKNITITVSSRKIDTDKNKAVGLFKVLDGAYIENLNIENMKITLNVNSGIPVEVGPLAVQANNTELKNVHINGLTISTGKGDDGEAVYTIGDLFATHKNTKLENVTGNDIDITASEFAKMNTMLE